MNSKIPAFASAISILFLAASLPLGCYYDNEVEQYGISILECDTVAISYSQDIVPIIQSNCISCHAPGGERSVSPFTTHGNIKNYATSQMVEYITGVGAIVMPPPPAGEISDCNQQKIEAWINAGAPNN